MAVIKQGNMIKTLTLQEANGLLPLVREHFFRIHMMLAHLQHLRKGLGKARHLIIDNCCTEIKLVQKKRHRKKSLKTKKEVKELEGMIENEVNGLTRLGVVIKGLLPPHIDFLSVKNNELIFLCWHGGEGEICHWHYLDDGSQTRHNIAQKTGFGPHMVH